MLLLTPTPASKIEARDMLDLPTFPRSYVVVTEIHPVENGYMAVVTTEEDNHHLAVFTAEELVTVVTYSSNALEMSL